MSINALTRAKVLYSLPEFLRDFKRQELGNDKENSDCFLTPSSDNVCDSSPDSLGIGGPFTEPRGKMVSLSIGMATTAYCYEQKKGVSYRRNRDTLLDLCRYFMFFDPKTGKAREVPQTKEQAALDLREWLREVRDRCADLGVYEKDSVGEDFLPYSLPAFSNRIIPEDLAAEAFTAGKLSDMDVSSIPDSMNRLRKRIERAVNQHIDNKEIGEKDRNEVELFLIRLALEYSLTTGKMRERLNTIYGEAPPSLEGFIRFPLEGYKLEYRENIVELLTVRHLFGDLIRVRSNEIGGMSYLFILEEEKPKKEEDGETESHENENKMNADVKYCDTGFNQSLRSFWGIQLSDVNQALKTVHTETKRQKEFFRIMEKSDSFIVNKAFTAEEAKSFFCDYCEKTGLYPDSRGGGNKCQKSKEEICLFNRKARYAARLTTLLRIMADQKAAAGEGRAIPFRTAPWLRISDDYLEFERELLKELAAKVQSPLS